MPGGHPDGPRVRSHGLLAGLPAPWYVAAGWALDLFRGVQTREHGDIEIATPAAHFPEVCDRFPDTF